VRSARNASLVLLFAVGFDLLCALVGGFSLAAPASALTPAGLAVRLALFYALFALRFRALAGPGQAVSGAHLLLVALLMPTLQQFQFAGGRTGGDGLGYYVFVRSLWKDGDLHFANEYEHYGYQDRADMMAPTRTGHRRSVFSIGPAVLWTPFFGIGEGIGRLHRQLGAEVDLSGYGAVHVNACSLGSLLYGFLLVLLIHDLARRHFAPGLALLAALATWGGTFLHWYMVQHPLMAHALSGCAAGFVVWLWDRQRAQPSAWGHARLGLALGLAMTTRWQSGLLLLLPGLDLLARLWRERAAALPSVLRHGAALGALVAIGAFPQMAAWKTLFDEWLLTHPPHGIGWVRLWRPYLLETLWSSRHGLFAWTPVFLPAFLGLWPLVRRRFVLGAPLVPIVLFTTWVNSGAGDWWAGGAYSLRRFDPLLLPLALGLAAFFERAQEWVRRRPEVVAALLLVPVAAWSLLLSPGDSRLPPHFPQLARVAWLRMADAVGSPQTWPASWLFAWRTGRPPGAYDLAVGRYLFFRQGNLGGRIELGGARDDGGLLAEGFGPPVHEDGAEARTVRTRARAFAPLDLPETLTVRVRLRGPASVALAVNGHDLGVATLGAGWVEASWRADARLWRKDLNDVVLETRSGPVLVDYFQFQQEPRP
jgi:hypothetical protein